MRDGSGIDLSLPTSWKLAAIMTNLSRIYCVLIKTKQSEAKKWTFHNFLTRSNWSFLKLKQPTYDRLAAVINLNSFRKPMYALQQKESNRSLDTLAESFRVS